MGNIPDGDDQSVGFHFRAGNDVPSQSDTISVFYVSPAVFELVILCLIHVGWRGGYHLGQGGIVEVSRSDCGQCLMLKEHLTGLDLHGLEEGIVEASRRTLWRACQMPPLLPS